MSERTEVSSTECCKAPGCPNRRSQGRFEGDFCVPCHQGQQRLAKAAAAGYTLGGVENWNSLTANCAAVGMERANFLAGRLQALTEWLEKNQPDVFTRGIWEAMK